MDFDNTIEGRPDQASPDVKDSNAAQAHSPSREPSGETGKTARERLKAHLRQPRTEAEPGQAKPSRADRGSRKAVPGAGNQADAEQPEGAAAKANANSNESDSTTEEAQTAKDPIPHNAFMREKERWAKRAQEGWKAAQEKEIELRKALKFAEMAKRELEDLYPRVNLDPRDLENKALKYQMETQQYLADLPQQVQQQFAQQAQQQMTQDAEIEILQDVDAALSPYASHPAMSLLGSMRVSPRIVVMERMQQDLSLTPSQAAAAVFQDLSKQIQPKPAAPRSPVRSTNGQPMIEPRTGDVRKDFKAFLRGRRGMID